VWCVAHLYTYCIYVYRFSVVHEMISARRFVILLREMVSL